MDAAREAAAESSYGPRPHRRRTGNRCNCVPGDGGHADVRTTLAIYTHAMKRKHDDSADRMAELAGLTKLGNIRETSDSVESEETGVSACFDGSPGCSGEVVTTP